MKKVDDVARAVNRAVEKYDLELCKKVNTRANMGIRPSLAIALEVSGVSKQEYTMPLKIEAGKRYKMFNGGIARVDFICPEDNPRYGAIIGVELNPDGPHRAMSWNRRGGGVDHYFDLKVEVLDLQLGKSYITNDGTLVTMMHKTGDDTYPFYGKIGGLSRGAWYTAEGKIFNDPKYQPHALDIRE